MSPLPSAQLGAYRSRLHHQRFLLLRAWGWWEVAGLTEWKKSVFKPLLWVIRITLVSLSFLHL